MDNNSKQSVVSSGQKDSFFTSNKFILILIIMVLILAGVYFLVDRPLASPTPAPLAKGNSLISNARSISGVSENQDELFKLIGFDDMDISNVIIKTIDGKYLIFSADKKDCSQYMSCTAHSYVVNVDQKTLSDFKINSVFYYVTPVFGSLVVTSLNNKMLVYDLSKNEIIDEIEYTPSQDGSIMPFYNFSFGSDKYYTYTYKNILYSRDISKHASTKIGNFYDPEVLGIDSMKMPAVFSENGEIFYTLIYINNDDTRPYSNMPEGDSVTFKDVDPLKLIAWNFKDNTSKVITTQTFNLPFIFKLLAQKSILIGGGRSNFGQLTSQTYLVNIETGESKLIYDGTTNKVNVDETKQTLTILGSKSATTYWTPYRKGSDFEIVFDYNGNIISKNDLINGELVSPKSLN